MHIAVYLPLALPAVATVSARWLGRRLRPITATWLLTISALLLAAASGAALALLAATVLGQLPLLAFLGHWSAGVIRRDDPASVALAIAAGLLLAVALAAVCRAASRRLRAAGRAARTARGLPRTGLLAVLDDPVPDAYAVPGWPGRVVVTAGMLNALDARERRVLLAHEHTHLACGHWLFVAAAQLAAAANPLLRPLATAVRYTTERWADETAARHVGDRRLAARTIAKAALLTSGSRPTSPAAMAIAAGRINRAGPVPRRVAALLAAPPREHPLVAGLALALLSLAGGSTLEAARDLHILFQMAGSP